MSVVRGIQLRRGAAATTGGFAHGSTRSATTGGVHLVTTGAASMTGDFVRPATGAGGRRSEGNPEAGMALLNAAGAGRTTGVALLRHG